MSREVSIVAFVKGRVQNRALIWSVLCCLAGAVNLLFDNPTTRFVSGMPLMLVFPGHALIRLLPFGSRPNPLLKGCVSLGLSLLLSSVLFMLMVCIVDQVDTVGLIAGLVILSVGMYLTSPMPAPRYDWRNPRLLIPVALLIGASLLRLPQLGYSDFQGDEADNCLRYCLELLNGEGEVVFGNRRPPTQLLVAAMGYLLSGNFDELFIRFPFSVAGIAIVLMVYFIGKEMYGEREGLIAGALTAVSGYAIAFSRILQYQTIVVLSVCLTVYFAHRVMGRKGDRDRTSLLLAFAFLGYSTFSHYEGFIVAPVLAYCAFKNYRSASGGMDRKGWMTGIVLFAVIAGLFYLPFILGPKVDEVGTFYKSTRFGGGLLHFNWKVMWYSAVPYNSLPFLGMVALLSLLSLRRARDPRSLMIWLWFFSYFLVFMIFMRKPNTHIQNFFYPWFILAAVGFTTLFDAVLARLPAGRARRAAAVFLVASLVGVTGYTVVFDVDNLLGSNPERIWRRPKSERPRYGIFGFPYHRAWKSAGYLFRSGKLSGNYVSNEKPDVTNFYLRQKQQRKIDRAKYFIQVEKPHPWSRRRYKKPKKGFRPIAVFTSEAGRTKMTIYERTKKEVRITRYVFRAFDDAYHALDKFPPPLIEKWKK